MSKKRGGKRPGAGRKPTKPVTVTVALGATLAATAQAHTAAALAALIAVMSDARYSGTARAMAAIAVLDRGWGRPVQGHEHTGKDGGAIATKNEAQYSDLEVARRIAFLLSQAAGEPEPEDER